MASSALRASQASLTTLVLWATFLVHVSQVVADRSGTSNLVDALTKHGIQDPEATRETLNPREAGVEACRGIVTLSGPTGHILSPPVQYDPAVVRDCTWVVVAPPGQIIRFQLHRLMLDCADNDTFEVTSFSRGDVTRRRPLLTQCERYSVDYLTDLEDDAIYTDVNVARVRLRARQNTYKAMHMKYEALDGHPGCYNGETEHVTDPSGHRSSPYLETGYYPYSTRCNWLFVAPVGYIIKLQFTSFDITYDKDCTDDVVQLRDGDSSDDIAATLCGSSVPLKFASTGNRLSVNFQATADKHKGGFNFTWTFVKAGQQEVRLGCGGAPAVIRGDDEGVIESPQVPGTDSYPDSANCSWIIVVNETKVVQLYFELFSLQGESPECLHDYVTIFDGTQPVSSALRQTFCGHAFPRVVLGSSNAMLVTFMSDGSVTSTGFRFTYRARTITPCGIPAIEPRIGISDSFVPHVTTTPSPAFAPVVMPGAIMAVVGGQETVPHSWPWQVLLTYNGRFRCSGTIVHRRWVVTAAHCFDWASVDYFNVVVGLHHQSTEQYWDNRTHVIRRLLTAPVYESPSYQDLALLELRDDIVFSAAVSPVCLPEHNLVAGAVCAATGWGETEEEPSSETLRQAKHRVISQEVCAREDWWGDYVNNFTVCADYSEGGRYVGVCGGDSGGPLVCRQNGRWSLYGVTSFGSNDCVDVQKPPVFTRVDQFVDWIQEATHGDVLMPSPSG